ARMSSALTEILPQLVVRYGIKIRCRIAMIFAIERGDFANDDVDGLVGEFVGAQATTHLEENEQATPQGFILKPCFFTIWIKPSEEEFKTLRRQIPVLHSLGEVSLRFTRYC